MAKKETLDVRGIEYLSCIGAIVNRKPVEVLTVRLAPEITWVSDNIYISLQQAKCLHAQLDEVLKTSPALQVKDSP